MFLLNRQNLWVMILKVGTLINGGFQKEKGKAVGFMIMQMLYIPQLTPVWPFFVFLSAD